MVSRIVEGSGRFGAGSSDEVVAVSALYGLGALAGGISSSFQFDWRTGPAIVVDAAVLLLISLGISRLFENRAIPGPDIFSRRVNK